MASTPRQVPAWQPDVALLEGITVAAVALDAGGLLLYANPAAADLLGLPLPEMVGHDVRLLLFEEPERGAVDQVLKLVERSGTWAGELTMLTGRAGARPVPTSWTRLGGAAGGALVLIEGTNDRATDPYAAGRPLGTRLRRLADVTSEMLGAKDVETVSAIVSNHLMTAAGATAASLSLVEGDSLRLVLLRGGLEDDIEDWRTLPLSANLPGCECARTRRTVFVTRAEVAERYPDLPLAEGTGSILCLPMVVTGDQALGTVTLSFPGRRQVSEAEGVFLRLLVDTCAMTIDRIIAQAAATDREAKLAFLAQASAQLAGDLDYETTLTGVAESAVPWFADWCAVAVAQDGVLRTIAVAHAKPESDALVRRLQEEYPAEPGDGSYVTLETGQSMLYPEVTDELLVERAKDPEHLELLRQLHMRSALVCPLTVGDRTFGVITWVAGEGGRRFTEEDEAFGIAFAQRAAVAIDNAQLHSQIRTAALELQRAVLPESLPRVPGWSTSVTYLPAGRTDTGGDFYDVVPLQDGRLAMFVGDVMGRGVTAASVMAQMRSAIRTLVAVNPAPASVLAGMDRVFDALHLEQLVTMVYAVADPALDHLQVINAGHPPPVLITAEGRMEVLAHSSTLILGVGGGQRAVRSVDLRPGDRLLLYTDGLVERRGEDADSATTRLLAALGAPRPGGPDAWLAEVVDEMRDPTRDDDVLALLVGRDPARG